MLQCDNFFFLFPDLKEPSIKQCAPPTKSVLLKKASKPAETKDCKPQEDASGGTSFRFNFNVDIEDKTEAQEVAPNPQVQESKTDPAVNYWKMVPTNGNETFRFNFKVDPE